MNTEKYPYALVVRWPVGGIRTHMKYSKEMLGAEDPAFMPVYISYDDEDTRLALTSLHIPPEANESSGIHSLLGMLVRVLKVCRNRHIKVIHSHGFISSIISTPAAWLFRKKHVVSVHDVITDEVIGSTSLLSRVVLGLCLRSAYAVHAVGEDCAQSIGRLPLMKTAKNIVIIRIGIDPKRFTNTVPADLRTLSGAGKETKLVGFFGRFHRQKGFRHLIDALGVLKCEHPNVEFKVIAVGSAGTLLEDKGYIAEKGLGSSFFFHPQVENPASLMAACDMIAMPSLWEAYGLLAAEALTLGVPLIASNCIGLAEAVKNTPARVVPAGDTKALAAALLAEALEPTKKAALDFVPQARAYFDFTKNARKLNRLLYLAQSGKPLSDLG